jgi:cytoskeletal protein CcmA (bactofilin family)
MIAAIDGPPLPRKLTRFSGECYVWNYTMFGRRRARAKPARAGGLAGFIDEGSEIEGRYRFSGTVMVNGRFNGEIVSGDTLIVGEKGVVRATVRAGTVVVNGEITGDVHASERVELRGQAKVFGDVHAPVVIVEEGVVFEGRCRMSPTETAATRPGADPLESLPVAS